MPNRIGSSRLFSGRVLAGRNFAPVRALRRFAGRVVSWIRRGRASRSPDAGRAAVSERAGAERLLRGEKAASPVYRAGSAKIALGEISAKEVDEIMPHLLSRRLKEGMRDSEKADVLHLKQEYRVHQKNAEAMGAAPNEAELEALSDYIESPEINRAIGLGGGAEKLRGRNKSQYHRMMSGLEKLPDHQGVVYRGTRASKRAIENFADGVGDIFSSRAFVSTSTSANFAKAFSEGDVNNHPGANCEVMCQIIQQGGKNISGVEDALERARGACGEAEGYQGNGEVLIKPEAAFRLVAFGKHTGRESYGLILKEVEGRLPLDKVRESRRGEVVGERGSVVEGLSGDFLRAYDARGKFF